MAGPVEESSLDKSLDKLSGWIRGKPNRVPERIKYTYQRKIIDGRFTHQVGRFDKVFYLMNVGVILVGLGLSGALVKDMILGVNKKEGF
mmetsp:Transcript_10902/g.18642  ORF Transcript_10902/g.18642 Transcript_10902/m.18642 type:complete len:89 (+) Transcript_10902:140-406(+)|eukprot:CAMPEP_0184691610 /NCGR_PEP_ID=MMETSP0313-20130426/408_1 /TAXON_ID=2792 /ORGANISM="Porphyridium aerugineum, Strain SAG 1380-2" /LENGTH=88 /DNA_ID=CAMNT_0027149355 /DNA_START=114 /DNA_END=380 /DNA_ORIENTATION=-